MKSPASAGCLCCGRQLSEAAHGSSVSSRACAIAWLRHYAIASFLLTRAWVRQQGGCPLGLLLPRADDRTLIRHPSR